MRRTFGLVLVLALALTLLVAPTATAAGHEATLNIVHGLDQARVDVCAGPAGGELSKIIRDFRFGSVETFALEPGSYDATVIARKGDCVDDAILSASGLMLQGGDNVDVIAHLDAGGAPDLSVFANETRTIDPGRIAYVPRHAAAAPAVDVWVSKGGWALNRARTIFSGVENGQGGSKLLEADTWALALSVTGSSPLAIPFGPVVVDLSSDQMSYITYVVSDRRGDLTAIIHTIDRG